MERNTTVAVCKKLKVIDGCGSCTIHSSRNYPSTCREYYCEPARRRMAIGKNPCKGCDLTNMLEQGCCNNNLGFGTKRVEIDDTRDSEGLAAPNLVLEWLADQILKAADKNK